MTSIVHALGLDGKYYCNLLDNFHSAGIKPDALSAAWAKVVLRMFPGPVRVKARLVLVGDGIKIAKQGRKFLNAIFPGFFTIEGWPSFRLST